MREHLYEQLEALLGKPHAENVDLLIRLIDDLGDRPNIQHLSKRTWSYYFERSGIELYFDTVYEFFNQMNLYIWTDSVTPGGNKPYAGNLPFQITADDSEEQVQKKLPGGCMEVKDYRFDNDLRPLVLTFHFGTADRQSPGVGERKMFMVSVLYEDALHPVL